MTTITASANRPYGHVPGHNYLDVEIEAAGEMATLTITWGSAQGYDEEHGREEYSARGRDTADAIECVRDVALGEEQTDECRRLIHSAATRALRGLQCSLCPELHAPGGGTLGYSCAP